MSPQIPSKFTSYAALSPEDGKALRVQKYEFEPQPWTEDDIDVKVECTSICGSCLHTITSGWGKSEYPCTVGHEIVGTVVRAGSKSGHTVGSRVGIGAQGASCGTCEACKSHNENHCIQGVTGTYQGVVGGVVKQGGFADYHRTRGRFAIEIPESLPSETAAPFMCGGATLYNPLVRFGEKKQGLKVGIVGVGGLGHFGLLLGNALGYEMFALSSTASKKEDCIKMGVKEENFWVTSDIEATVKAHSNTLDLIIVASNQKKPPIADLYFPLLKFHGKCIFVGAAEAPFSEISPFAFLGKGVLLGGSMIAPPHQIKEMLDLVAEKKIHAWTQSRPMSELGQALKDMQQGKARYRYVMVNPSN